MEDYMPTSSYELEQWVKENSNDIDDLKKKVESLTKTIKEIQAEREAERNDVLKVMGFPG